MDFKTGDVVRLRSIRSPYMVVSHITEDEPKEIMCKWYSEEEEEFKSETFYPEMLEKVR